MYRTIAMMSILCEKVSNIEMSSCATAVRWMRGCVLGDERHLLLKDDFNDKDGLEHEIGHLKSITFPTHRDFPCIGQTVHEQCHIAESVAWMIACESLGARRDKAMNSIYWARTKRGAFQCQEITNKRVKSRTSG